MMLYTLRTNIATPLNSLVISLSFPAPKILIATTVKTNEFEDALSNTNVVPLVSYNFTDPLGLCETLYPST